MRHIPIPISYMLAMAMPDYRITGHPNINYSCWYGHPIDLIIQFDALAGFGHWNKIPLTAYERHRLYGSYFFGNNWYTPVNALITIG